MSAEVTSQSWLTLKNRDTSLTIDISYEEPILVVNEREYPLGDAASHAVLLLLAASGTKWAKYKDIADSVRAVKAKNYLASETDNKVAQKHVHSLKVALKKIGISDLTETLRSSGYRLDDRWIIVDNNPDGSDQRDVDAIFLNELRTIIDRLVACCNSTNLTSSASGLKYMTPPKLERIELFIDLDDCYRRFLETYSRPGNGVWLFPLRNKINELLSYCVFWRVGDGLDDSKWKADYKNELDVLFNQINSELATLVATFENNE